MISRQANRFEGETKLGRAKKTQFGDGGADGTEDAKCGVNRSEAFVVYSLLHGSCDPVGQFALLCFFYIYICSL